MRHAQSCTIAILAGIFTAAAFLEWFGLADGLRGKERAERLAREASRVGARVSSAANPSEGMVSSTFKDLVAGSGIEFLDRGMRALKGVPAKWRLFAVK